MTKIPLPSFNSALFAVVLITAVSIIDFLDLKLGGLGINLFSRNRPDILVLFATAEILFLTLMISYEQYRILTRPYIRVAWDSGPMHVSDRSEQGIKHACVILANDGKGIARNIVYTIYVADQKADVRNHTIISAGSATAVVYTTADSREILGKRFQLGKMSADQIKLNGSVIYFDGEKSGHIKIEGSYEDLLKNTYSFEFISDPTQQSSFREVKPQ